MALDLESHPAESCPPAAQANFASSGIAVLVQVTDAQLCYIDILEAYMGRDDELSAASLPLYDAIGAPASGGYLLGTAKPTANGKVETAGPAIRLSRGWRDML